jgi:exosome complex exonuclease RRP6
MFYYARSDTHYLLYIYDMVRNELVEKSDTSVPEKNWIDWVLQKSKEISLQRYETPLCDVETGKGSRGWFNVLVKSPAGLNAEQFAVYKAVFKWRDDLARREDESPHFVMAQNAVADIARVLPADPKALWSLVGHASQLVKGRIDELFDLIHDAREKGRTGPTMMDFFRSTNSVAAVARRVFGDREKEKSKAVEAPVPGLEELRAERSQLWGDMPMSSRWENGRRLEEDGQIALPWTTYVQGMVGEAMEVETPEESTELDMIPLQDPEPEVVPDEDFTLKQGKSRGKKRKTEELEERGVDEPADESKPATEGESETPAPTEEERQAKKLQRKERRKAEKKLKAAARMSDAQPNDSAATTEGEASGPAEDEEEPFDYSKAATVLHAQGGPNGDSGRQRRGKKPKVFDPYAAKTQDNSLKGARKLNYEKSGRSATFKK